MKTRWWRGLWVGVWLIAPVSPAQEPPPAQEIPVDVTADELMARVERALGSAEAWKRVTATASRGVVEIDGTDQAFAIEEVSRAPDRMVIRMKRPDGTESSEGCDGTVAWESDAAGTRQLKGDELREGLDDCVFLHPFALGRAYKELKVAGKARQGEREFYLVDAFRPNGEQEVLTIDARTYLPELHVIRRHIEGKLVAISKVFGDYRDVGGLKLPHLQRAKVGDTKLTLRLTSIEVNPAIDDSIFATPRATVRD